MFCRPPGTTSRRVQTKGVVCLHGGSFSLCPISGFPCRCARGQKHSHKELAMAYAKASGRFAVAGLFLAALLALSSLQASPHDPSASSAHAGHEAMDMPLPMPGQTQDQAARQVKRVVGVTHSLACPFQQVLGDLGGWVETCLDRAFGRDERGRYDPP